MHLVSHIAIALPTAYTHHVVVDLRGGVWHDVMQCEQAQILVSGHGTSCASLARTLLSCYFDAQDMAEQYKFIIVAPDSRTAALSGWSVPLSSEPPSPDVLHTQARRSVAAVRHGGITA